jgi:protein O-mannosyl-transferase
VPDLRRLTWPALVVAAALAAYGSALGSGFVWDDHRVIENGQLIGSLANIPRLYAHNTMWNSDGGAFARTATVDTYRPLTMTSFALERALFGLAPAGYHATSVLVHAVNALLVLLLGLRLGLGRAAAGGGAVLFAVHPSISEAVHWINGRSDPLAVMFFLLALLTWWPLVSADASPAAGTDPGQVRARWWGRALGTAVLALAASLCKETVFMLALALALPLLHRRVPWRRWPLLLAPWAVGLGAGLALRLAALGKVAASAGPAHLAYAAARVPLLWRDALGSLLSPAPRLEPSLHQRYAELTAGGLLLAALVVGAALALALWGWRRGQLLGPWALGAVLLALAPIALLTRAEGWSGWGRYLYPAAPLACLFVGWLVAQQILPRARPRLRRLLGVACALGLLVCAAQTFLFGGVWRDDESLALGWIAEAPDSAPGYLMLGQSHYWRRQPGRAVPPLERAVALAPDNAETWANLAMARAALGQRQPAWAAADRALQLDPRNRRARYIVALGLLGQGRQVQAAEVLVALIAEDPAEPGPTSTLAEAWSHTGAGSPFRRRVAQLVRDPRYRAVAARVPAD